MESDVFDSDGNKVKGFGGGICQVSTTLYNAVLDLDFIEIVERHPHSNTVPYIESGKDAAVAYGSLDLQLKNNSDFNIEVIFTFDEENVTVTILKG